jgi:hypothetical protein
MNQQSANWMGGQGWCGLRSSISSYFTYVTFSAPGRPRGRPRGSKSRNTFRLTPSTRTLRAVHQGGSPEIETFSNNESDGNSSMYSVEEVILKSPSKPKGQSSQYAKARGPRGKGARKSSTAATSGSEGKVSKQCSAFNSVVNGECVSETDVKFLDTLAATIRATRDMLVNKDTVRILSLDIVVF